MSTVVVGSVNEDSYLYVEALPKRGETVFAKPGPTGLGGKGANQAVAAALLGVGVRFVGRVGADTAGTNARRVLTGFGIDCTNLASDSTKPTGSAIVCSEPGGENSILVSAGANDSVLSGDNAESIFTTIGDVSTRVVLTQGELGTEAVDAIAVGCRYYDKRLVINLAPVIAVQRTTLEQADPLLLNQGEVTELLSIMGSHLAPVLDVDTALDAAAFFADQVCRSVVITLGSGGAVAAEGIRVWHQPALAPATVRDTTGAGDAFIGALVAALAELEPLESAVRTGTVAGSLSVEHEGTTQSYPDRAAVIAAVASLAPPLFRAAARASARG